jgi:hypothetical protein
MRLLRFSQGENLTKSKILSQSQSLSHKLSSVIGST